MTTLFDPTELVDAVYVILTADGLPVNPLQTGNQQVSPLAILPDVFTGMFAIMMIGMMVGMVAVKKDPKQELAELDESIRKMSFVKNNLNDIVTGHRNQVNKLMREYGITIIPSVAEMRQKYPKLYFAEQYLSSTEKNLDRVELNMMLKQKRRKQLRGMLGMAGGEE